MTYEDYFNKVEKIISLWDADKIDSLDAMNRIYDIGSEYHKSADMIALEKKVQPDCDMPGDAYP